MATKQAASIARAPARVVGFAGITLAMLAGVQAHQMLVPASRRAGVFDRHMRAWCRTLLRLFGVRVSTTGVVPGRSPVGRLVVSNHRSPIDIAILLTLFGGQFLSHSGVARWPVVGRAARKAGTIFVHRDRGTSGASAIRVMRRRLEQGATILVFPEGTTFEGDVVRPFRLGALVAARGMDVQVVPVGLAYEASTEWVGEDFLVYMRRMAQRRSTRVTAAVGEPIQTRGLDTSDIASLLHTQVQQLVTTARAQHPSPSSR